MTRFEFVVVMVWLLLPPLLVGMGILGVLHRKSSGRKVGETIRACGVLAVISLCIEVGLFVVSPHDWGRYLGIRDTPVLWAPIGVIAVCTALSITILWLSRKPGIPR